MGQHLLEMARSISGRFSLTLTLSLSLSLSPSPLKPQIPKSRPTREFRQKGRGRRALELGPITKRKCSNENKLTMSKYQLSPPISSSNWLWTSRHNASHCSFVGASDVSVSAMDRFMDRNPRGSTSKPEGKFLPRLLTDPVGRSIRRGSVGLSRMVI